MSDIKEIRETWENQPGTFPFFLEENPALFSKVGLEQKKENEALVQEFSQRIKRKMQQKPKKKEQQKRWEQELEADFMDFMGREKIICLSQWMSQELLLDCKEETKHFLDRVRGFDETLGDEQIWQTLRNYFIYIMIVEMQGEKQNADDPILAYSLLYPYTDNYIDDEHILREEKERYNRMIALKLNGEAVFPQTVLEERTCRLLDMILNAYDGTARDRVAETLLRLLKAQNRSIEQQKSEASKEQILEISISKGSASVLADYLFATDDWNEYEERFYLKFGFLLQLVDDLQDIEEDKKTGSRTLMTQKTTILLLLTISSPYISGAHKKRILFFLLMELPHHDKDALLKVNELAEMMPEYFSRPVLDKLNRFLPLALKVPLQLRRLSACILGLKKPLAKKYWQAHKELA